jgi:TrmH family RNA methyltransferase
VTEELITSRANARLKRARRLQSRRARVSSGLFVVEGEDLVEAAVLAGIQPVEVLVVPDAELPAGTGGEIVRVDAGLLAEIGTLGHPARVIAVFRTADLPTAPVGTVSLELHGVRDPGNVGTLVRGLAALGPGTLVLGPGTVDPLGPRAVRASMGAIFRTPIVEHAPPSRRVALTADADLDLADADLDGGITFVLGAEREGVSAEARASCDLVCRIPQAAGVDSLNVAMAGTIALYELRRRER